MSLPTRMKNRLEEAKERAGDLTGKVTDVAEAAGAEAKELADEVTDRLHVRTDERGAPPIPAHLNNLTQQAQDNTYFRRVLATGTRTQVVVMSIPPGGDIGEEVHPDNDQVLYLVQGSGQVILAGETADFAVGDLVLVTAGTRHNFKTVGETAMKIITTYSPPHHPDGTIHKTKADAAD